MMESSAGKLVCDKCRTFYASKYTLNRHIRSKHVVSKDNVSWTCDTCKRRYDRRDNLLRHIKNKVCFNQRNPSEFKCAKCDYKTKLKSDLQSHRRREHRDAPENELECYHCSQKFPVKHCLRTHIRVEHFNIANRKVIKCLKCCKIFSMKRLLLKHYEQAHEVQFLWENLKFNSRDEFTAWKIDLQLKTYTQFVLRNSHKSLTCTTQDFWCHRSGSYLPKCGLVRKRHLKEHGSRKLNGVCPAEILTKTYQDGTVLVRIQTTHIGHNLHDSKELRYISLDESIKDDIAAQIQAGVPLFQVGIRQVISNHAHESFDRRSLITYDDIYNIGRSKGVLPRRVEPHKSNTNMLNIESFADLYKDAILFCKLQGEDDTQFGILKLDDYAIVFMNEWQASILKQYAWKVVCMDSTRRINPYDFQLHTLLVLDIDREGVPVAFLISNRNDGHVIDIFLQLIRDRIGKITTRTFMSDTSPSYYNSWKKYMGPAEFQLHCSWHVLAAWRSHCAKIADKSKREIVRCTLHKLMMELEQGKFEKELKEFLAQKDPDLKDFLEYFVANYSVVTRWAYCYRQFALVNTNTHIEAFHRVLKRVIASGKEIKSLHDGLNYINDYIIKKESDMNIKMIRGKNTSKRQFLRKSHQFTADHLKDVEDFNIEKLSDTSWLVGSFNASRMYSVKKIEEKECVMYNDTECHLLCSFCDICYHEYACDCLESSIRQNMCKHIHKLGIYLKKMNDLEATMQDELVEEKASVNITCVPDMDNNDNDDLPSSTAVLNLKNTVMKEFSESLEAAQTAEEVWLIHNTFIRPIKSALASIKFEPETKVNCDLPESI